MGLFSNEHLNIESMNVLNNIGSDVDATFKLYRLNLAEGGKVTFNNLIYRNNTFNYYGLCTSTTTLQEFAITNSIFENDILGPKLISYLNTGSIERVRIENVTFTGLNYSPDRSFDPYLLVIPSIDLKNSENSIIRNVTITQSDAQFLQLDGFKNTPTTSSCFNFSDITITDISYKDYTETILFSNFNYQEDVVIGFKNILIQNLEYQMTGTPLKFEHFMK
jgi:hypothetical protein